MPAGELEDADPFSLGAVGATKNSKYATHCDGIKRKKRSKEEEKGESKEMKKEEKGMSRDRRDKFKMGRKEYG